MEDIFIQTQLLEMHLILKPGAKLGSFIIEENEETLKRIEEIQKLQERILELKEVNEEEMRQVVQL